MGEESIMPMGPSHSHSSGGGHSSGGFSSHGGGFASGGMRGPRRPMHFVFFGRTVVIGGARQALVSMLMVFFIISIFLTIGFGSAKASTKRDLNESKQYLQIMEKDNEYYKNMIEKAEEAKSTGIRNGYYITTATFNDKINYNYNSNSITGIYYLDDYNYYELFYIVYSFKNEYDTNGNGITPAQASELKGETYAQYTSNQVNGKDGEIEIVYHYDKDEARWVSINRDYTIDLTYNYEYLYMNQLLDEYEDSIKTSNTVFIVAIVADVIFFVLILLVLISAIKKAKKDEALKEEKAKAEIDEARAKASEAEANAAKKNRICAYCGCTVDDGESKCPACGSRKFIKKK